MNQLLTWLSQVFQSWKFWIVIAPWDLGVRIRLGKTAHAMKPGLHLRLPFIDDIVLVNTRMRVTTIPGVVRPGNGNGKLRTVAAAVGYRIVDPLKSLGAYSYPDGIVAAFGQAALAEGLDQERAAPRLRDEFVPNGIEIAYLVFTEDVEVRTLKLLNGSGGVHLGSGPVAPADSRISYH